MQVRNDAPFASESLGTVYADPGLSLVVNDSCFLLCLKIVEGTSENNGKHGDNTQAVMNF